MYCIGRSVPFFLPPFRGNSHLRFVAHVSRSRRKNALVHTHPPPSVERFASLSRSFVQLHYDWELPLHYGRKNSTTLCHLPRATFVHFCPADLPPPYHFSLHNFRCIISKIDATPSPAFRDNPSYVN